jgi:hypothetical protein
MSKAKTESGARENRKAAQEALAADIAKSAEPGLARAISGGDTQVSSETAHRISAAMARDSDRGHTRTMSEYINEARRR